METTRGRFPSDASRFLLWRNAGNCGNLSRKDRNSICSEHFTEDAYLLKQRILGEPFEKWQLSGDAVPKLKLLPESTPVQVSVLNDRTNRLHVRKRRADVSELLVEHALENKRVALNNKREKVAASSCSTQTEPM